MPPVWLVPRLALASLAGCAVWLALGQVALLRAGGDALLQAT